ncbi:DUF1758 domain-containing protein [Trichonephila clavipes]|nr:DUF1758 domain-containing protein [Trichonephila clavipes]
MMQSETNDSLSSAPCKQRSNDSPEYSICLNSDDSERYTLSQCQHTFHSICLRKWLDNGKKGLGIRDDPVLHERDQAIEIFKETVEFEKGRYIVQLPFRKSYNELSDNYPLAKQHFQNLWRRFGHDSELYQQYREIIRDYTEHCIIEEVKTEITDNELKRPAYYLPPQAVRKDGRLTSKTRIVFDAGSHQNNELSLNDCL